MVFFIFDNANLHLAFIDSNLNMNQQAMCDTIYQYCLLAEDNDSAAANNYSNSYIIGYLSAAGQWNSYAKKVEEDYQSNKKSYANSGINEAAWKIYENTSDKEALALALGWMHDVVDTDDEYNHADTYAALLYALKRYDEAETAAKQAIELAKRSGENYDQTKTLLGKIYTER